MPRKAAHRAPPAPPHLESHLVSLEKRVDGAVIVRVRSAGPDHLPDAVFAFRSGDPQYAYWLRRLQSAASDADSPTRNSEP